MTIAAEYHVSVPGLPVVRAAAALPDATVELDRVLTVDDRDPVLILLVDGAAPTAVAAALDDDPAVSEWGALGSDDEDRSLYRVVVDERFLELKALFVDVGGTPQGATVDGDGWRQRALFPDRRALASLRDAVVERGGTLRTDRLVDPDLRAGDAERAMAALTGRQRTALRVAFEQGYFEVPRRVSLADLGERLDLSTSATSTLLRRAERRLVAHSLRRRL